MGTAAEKSKITLQRVMFVEDNIQHQRMLSGFLVQQFPDLHITTIDLSDNVLPGRDYEWQYYDLLFISLHQQRDERKAWYQSLIGLRPPAIFIDDFLDEKEALTVTAFGAVDYIVKHKLNPERLMSAIFSTRGDLLLNAATEKISVSQVEDILDADIEQCEQTGVLNVASIRQHIRESINQSLTSEVIDFDAAISNSDDDAIHKLEETGQISILNREAILASAPLDVTVLAEHIKYPSLISDDLKHKNQNADNDPGAIHKPEGASQESIPGREAIPTSTPLDVTVLAEHIKDPSLISDDLKHENQNTENESSANKVFDFESNIASPARKPDIEQAWPFTHQDIKDGRARINYYHIIQLIGFGGVASVFKVQREHRQDFSAMKIINTKMVAGETVKKRFMREFEVGANLSNQHIVNIYAQGFEDDIAYIVMELLTGRSLKEKLRQSKPSPRQAINYFKDIATGLHELHSNGIIHRDLKPGNIMFREDGTLVLVDFGISKILHHQHGYTLTREGEMLGTPLYISPEQALGNKVDGRCDIYTLGIILYEMFKGRHPYTGQKAIELMTSHVRGPIPQLDEEWHEINKLLSTMLAKDPDDRFSNIEKLMEQVEKLPF